VEGFAVHHIQRPLHGFSAVRRSKGGGLVRTRSLHQLPRHVGDISRTGPKSADTSVVFLTPEQLEAPRRLLCNDNGRHAAGSTRWAAAALGLNLMCDQH
jgi:hypothetical protein